MKSILATALLGTAISAPLGLALAEEAKPAGSAAPMMTIDTPSFLKTVASANKFEIDSSKLALDKSTDKGIKAFADMVIADHTKAGEKLKSTLATKKIPPSPEDLAPKHAKMIEQLKAANGSDFEVLFIDMQSHAHMEAVALFRTYAGSGDEQAIVGFAKETLPALETHLHHVKELVRTH